MPYTIIMFVCRNSKLTVDEFIYHYERRHIPLAHSLLSDVWPTTFLRRYFARIHRKGFGGPANPDRPPFALRGDTNDLDCDCVAELTFPSEKAFHEFYKKIYEKEVAALLVEDENRFLEQGKLRVIVIGETCTTAPDGSTTSEKSEITMSYASDSALSSSDQS